MGAVAGVSTFSGLSIDQLGSGYTLVASSVGLTSGTSSTFNITAASPPVLTAFANRVFPSTAISQGVAMAAMDFNNTVTGNDVNMTYTCVYDQVVDGAVAAGTACTSLPGTATFNTSTGVFNWTPNTSAWGAYEFKVTGTNIAGSNSQIFVIDIFQGYPTANLMIDLDAEFAT